MSEKETYKIKVINEVYGESDSEDSDDGYGSWSEDISNDIRGIKVSEDYFDLIVNFKIDPNKAYWLVNVEYGTGDSFGHRSGNIEFVELCQTEEEAKHIKKLIEEHYEDYEKNKDYDKKLVLPMGEKKFEYTFTPPWVGYFESIESINITLVRMV